MRLLVLMFVAACSDDACPLPSYNTPLCVKGGLEDVQLSGTWTLTGKTWEGYRSDVSAPQDITRDITFGDSCNIGNDDFVGAECGIDNNLASCELPSDAGNDRTLVVCKSSEGELVYQSFVSRRTSIPTNPYVIYVNGVLSR